MTKLLRTRSRSGRAATSRGLFVLLKIDANGVAAGELPPPPPLQHSATESAVHVKSHPRPIVTPATVTSASAVCLSACAAGRSVSSGWRGRFVTEKLINASQSSQYCSGSVAAAVGRADRRACSLASWLCVAAAARAAQSHVFVTDRPGCVFFIFGCPLHFFRRHSHRVNITPVEIHDLRTTVAYFFSSEFRVLAQFYIFCIQYIKYPYNMTAWFHVQFSDVTVPHVHATSFRHWCILCAILDRDRNNRHAHSQTPDISRHVASWDDIK